LNAPCPDEEMEKRVLKKIQDVKKHPEKYPHILKRGSSEGSKIPPVSTF
jgi:hypothetical protein